MTTYLPASQDREHAPEHVPAASVSKKDLRPRCPRCGEPARSAVVRAAAVTVALNPDGGFGSVQAVTRLGRSVTAYLCGGRHRWGDEEER